MRGGRRLSYSTLGELRQQCQHGGQVAAAESGHRNQKIIQTRLRWLIAAHLNCERNSMHAFYSASGDFMYVSYIDFCFKMISWPTGLSEAGSGSGSGEFALYGTGSSESPLSTGLIIGLSLTGFHVLLLPTAAMVAWIIMHEHRQRQEAIARGQATPAIDVEMASPDQPAVRVQMIAGSKIRCPTCRLCSESQNVRPIFFDTPIACLICLERYSSGLGALSCGHVLCLRCVGKVMVPPAPSNSLTLVVRPEETDVLDERPQAEA